MEFTLAYLRKRAALYREKAATATKPSDIKRHREFAELLEQQTAVVEEWATDRERQESE